MKTATASAVLAALLAAAEAAPTGDLEARDVDTMYPYTGPAVPVGDWVDPTVKGNGKGFPRLVEAPAVKPKSSNPKNNINVISLAYAGPNGINIHYQTPFGLGESPSVRWGETPWTLFRKATGATNTYDRTPPCSLVDVTQCSQYFHNVQLANLRPDTTYFYQIEAANGTTQSSVMSFKTARSVGDKRGFSIAVLNDMGYTNAQGTHKQLTKVVDEGIAFAWHGGDLSYADDWYSGILPCEDSWPLCYNGTSTELPNTPPAPFPPEYNAPLPAGEIPNQGGPQGGDMSVLYESNWDLWQQWQNSISTKVPYMTLPGNHEAACAEFDGPGNILTAYLNDDKANSTAPKSNLTYYSCPPSQRNFTTFQHRFRMPGDETGGRGNMWYSFDYGMVHFISLDSETDFAYSPSYPFLRDLKPGETHPTPGETFSTDAGPFGRIDGNNWKDNKAYEQYQWLQKDLQAVDRSKTPWVIAMSHRPMYSSQVSSYQSNIRNAWQALMLENGVDAYLAGHIHWYERMYPMTQNGTIDTTSVVGNNTYMTNPGVSMTHLTNGMAGNIESHSTLGKNKRLTITAALNMADYGFNKVTFHDAGSMTFQFIKGDGSGVGDEVTLMKKGAKSYSPPRWSPPGGWPGFGGWW